MTKPIVYICKACAGVTEGCTYTRDPAFISEQTACPEDAGKANWVIKTEQCKFEMDWAGRCTETAIPGSDYCIEHNQTKCCVCGSQATHSCDHTGQFVCGYPLCDDCIGIEMNGIHRHVSKKDWV